MKKLVLLILTIGVLGFFVETAAAEESTADPKPNILWLSTEDIGPHLGCYGDPDAVTPNLDRFASQSMIYDYAWSNYPVCAPARTTIIAGMYASSNGAGNMRSGVKLPEGMELFPAYLRQAGYYCTNNSKTDYNYLGANDLWDASSNKAHYRNREEGQPFFAVFNYTGTHESKIRKRPHEQVIDPATVHLKSYWPDLPEVREDWAQYHDNITTMDGWIQKHLDQLEKAGLANNTIVVFFGDHGSGMPRHKRFAGNSGQHVPFIVHVPEKLKAEAGADYQPGKHLSRPVGFIDLAPTMLSIAGVEPPKFMQGHAFLGKYQQEAHKYLYGFRDRMDERPDTSRAIRDERFVYVRNYMPHIPAGQFVNYQQQTPTTNRWYELFKAGKLNEVQAHFWKPHPAEELYDLDKDPDETVNLIDDPAFASTVERFRKEHQQATLRFHDLGLIPEAILYEYGQGGEKARTGVLEKKAEFPFEEIVKVANLAANPKPEGSDTIKAAMSSESDSVRYWAALGVLVDGKSGFDAAEATVKGLQKDDCPSVAIVASESVARYGSGDEKVAALENLVRLADTRNSNFYAAIHAINALDRVGVSPEIVERLRSLPEVGKTPRGGNYVGQLLADLDRETNPKPRRKKKDRKSKKTK